MCIDRRLHVNVRLAGAYWPAGGGEDIEQTGSTTNSAPGSRDQFHIATLPAGRPAHECEANADTADTTTNCSTCYRVL